MIKGSMVFAKPFELIMEPEDFGTQLEKTVAANRDFGKMMDGARWMFNLILVSMYNTNERLTNRELGRFYKAFSKDLEKRVNEFIKHVEIGDRDYFTQLGYHDDLVRKQCWLPARGKSASD